MLAAVSHVDDDADFRMDYSLTEELSEWVVHFSKWLQDRSLDEISRRSAALFCRNLAVPTHASLAQVSAQTLVLALFHDRSLPVMRQKLERLHQLLMQNTRDPEIFASLAMALGDAMRSEFASQRHTHYNGGRPLSETIAELFGKPYRDGILAASVACDPGLGAGQLLATPFDENATLLCQKIEAVLIQTRVREEILRDDPTMRAELAYCLRHGLEKACQAHDQSLTSSQDAPSTTLYPVGKIPLRMRA